MEWGGDHWYVRGLALICAMAIAPGEASLYGQSSQQNQAVGKQQGQFMTPEQLDSLISPIALYSDSLLAQVLAASTYPLQIVIAERWVQQNKHLKGKELMEAAGKQDWDPSIQALVAFPTVLQMMDQSLDWTTALGNAFLAEQPDVMAAAERMRIKAQQSGKLQSNTQFGSILDVAGISLRTSIAFQTLPHRPGRVLVSFDYHLGRLRLLAQPLPAGRGLNC
jgi:hypothetical protein